MAKHCLPAATYNQTITIEQPTLATDGETTPTAWTLFESKVRANVRDIRASERLRGEQVAATIQTVVQIRYSTKRANVTPQMRIKHGTRTLNITGIARIHNEAGGIVAYEITTVEDDG
jgi:SPP1 family predicted phage head-tail adaptor